MYFAYKIAKYKFAETHVINAIAFVTILFIFRNCILFRKFIKCFKLYSLFNFIVCFTIKKRRIVIKFENAKENKKKPEKIWNKGHNYKFNIKNAI